MTSVCFSILASGTVSNTNFLRSVINECFHKKPLSSRMWYLDQSEIYAEGGESTTSILDCEPVLSLTGSE